MSFVDLRSDTITRPTPAMRQAMAEAVVGDDVFGDDPTVNALQERSAAILGKEAALFLPSGTMANQVAIRTHTEPGDEIVVESTSHIFLYEGGGFAAMSGVSAHCVVGQGGLLDPADVRAAIRPPGGLSHFPVTRLVCIENTANRGGGRVYQPERVEAIAEVAHAEGLQLHLDGARFFNAVVALGRPPGELAAPFDSIAFCLSKGLGCPVGSLLVGSRTFIDRAHRFRKMFGGGMRQAGILAAAGLYALEHNVERLAEDHARARRLAEALDGVDGLSVDLEAVETNMVYVDLTGGRLDAAQCSAHLEERGVRVVATSETQLRAVSHLDVDDDGIDHAVEAFVAAVSA